MAFSSEFCLLDPPQKHTKIGVTVNKGTGCSAVCQMRARGPHFICFPPRWYRQIAAPVERWINVPPGAAPGPERVSGT